MLENRYPIKVNLKKKEFQFIPEVIANDSVVFEVEVWDGTKLFTFETGYTFYLTSLKRGESLMREGTLENNKIIFKLGQDELTDTAKVEATVQIFDADMNRVSAAKFDYKVIKDPSLNGEFATSDSPSFVIADESLLTETINKSNQASTDSTTALTKATSAETKATAAETTANEVRDEFDQVVAEAGSSNPEVVQARGGEVTLKARLDKVDSSLAQRPTQNEVNSALNDISVSQINKNKGKFDQTYMTDEFLQQMAGTTPINAVPADGGITKPKLDTMLLSEIENKVKFDFETNVVATTDNRLTLLRGDTGNNGLVYDESATTISKTYALTDVDVDLYAEFSSPHTSGNVSFLLVNGSYSYPISTNGVQANRDYFFLAFNTVALNTYKLSFDTKYGLRIKRNKATNDWTFILYDMSKNILFETVVNFPIVLTSFRSVGTSVTVSRMRGVSRLLTNFEFTKSIDGRRTINKASDSNLNKYEFECPVELVETEDGKPLMEYINSIDNKYNYLNRHKNKEVVHFGDSITGNYDAPDSYPYFVGEFLKATAHNVGFGGCRMATVGTDGYNAYTMHELAKAVTSGDYTYQDANTGLSSKYPTRLATLKAINFAQVDMLTIFYGTNDFTSNVPLDNESNKMDTTTYAGATRYAIDKLLTSFPNLKIMLITPMWRGRQSTGDGKESDTVPNGAGVYLYQYGEKLKEVAKEFKIPVLDMYYTSTINKYNRLYYLSDDLHPNEIGRKHLASKIVGELSRVF